MAFVARLGAVGALVTGTIALAGTPAMANDGHHTINVEPGVGTISAAVAAAKPGDTLQLEEGTFWDSVFIAKTLTIRGEGDETVIMPPKSSNNPCNSPGSVEGLCVVGALDAQGNPILSQPVVDVQISDLRTTGFSDSGVFGFNTKGLRVNEVAADHNGGYGIARFNSTDSLFTNNHASYNGEAGLYVGDSPDADSAVVGNRAEHNGYGIFLRDSTDVTAAGNASWGNCVGILALNSGKGATGPTGAGDYLIRDNTVNGNNASCSGQGPPTSGIGIGLVGVQGVQVVDNEANGNRASGPSVVSGGVVILSPQGRLASDNLVKDNELRGNQPADIVWDGKGLGNRVIDNECTTAIPGNLEWCSSDSD
jgi:nitrous oxidase accessory protein NosD